MTEQIGPYPWDRAKAQAIMVWEDLAGRLWVADGHQRAGLARRLTEKGRAENIELPGVLYREKDGISADDIRAIAARHVDSDADLAAKAGQLALLQG